MLVLLLYMTHTIAVCSSFIYQVLRMSVCVGGILNRVATQVLFVALLTEYQGELWNYFKVYNVISLKLV